MFSISRHTLTWHQLTKLKRINQWSHFSPTGIIIETYLECCNHGVKHATTNFSCNHTTYGISINPIWHSLCMSASTLCCTNHLESEFCLSGQGAARGKVNCDEVKFVTNESSIFRDCCKSCQIGLAVAAENGSCSDTQILSSLSKSVAEAFSNCCNGSFEEIIISEGKLFFISWN